MRTVLSLVLLAAILWASCTVKLGVFTLAEHVDRIGETDEAKALLEGTRGKIAPVLEDMKQRVLGEYVEAPTAPPKAQARAKGERAGAGREAGLAKAGERGAEGAATPTGPRTASSSEEGKLPGRASREAANSEAEPPRLPAKAAVGASGEVPRGAPTPTRESRAPSTSEAARLPGARRAAQP